MVNDGMGKVVHRYIECVGYVLLTPFRWLLEFFMSRLGFVFIYRVYSSGLGDSLAISSVLNAINEKRGPIKAVIFSKYPELFLHNPLVVMNINYNEMFKINRSLLKSFAKYMRGKRVICVGLEKWVLGTFPWRPYEEKFNERWLRQMVPDFAHEVVGLDHAAPRIYFSEQERNRFVQIIESLPDRFGVIKATGNARHGFRVLKEWGVEKFQRVVSKTSDDLAWVQIGEAADKSIDGAIDMRGLPIREMFYLLSIAKLTLTIEGFISHSAAAFKSPVIVVFSGYHASETLTYSNTIPVVAEPKPACAPCYLYACPYSEQYCMSGISVDQVVTVIERVVNDEVRLESLHTDKADNARATRC